MKITHLVSINMVSSISAKVHNQSFRKDRKTPYIVHPARVAALVAHFGGNHIAIIAAWIHDVFEDCDSESCKETNVAIENLPLRQDERKKIKDILIALTKKSNLPKNEQMTDSLDRILVSPPEAILIKICDRIDNLIDAKNADKEFIIKYYKEAKNIAEILEEKAIDSGYKKGLDCLNQIIKDYYNENSK